MAQNTDPTTSARRLAAGTPTADLLAGLLVLELKPLAERTTEERLAWAWIAEEIEARYPEVAPAMEAWVDNFDTDLTYGEALLVSLPMEALR